MQVSKIETKKTKTFTRFQSYQIGVNTLSMDASVFCGAKQIPSKFGSG